MKDSGFKQLGNQITARIRALAARRGESNSVASISRRCNMPQSTLNYKMNHPRNFTLDDFYFIARGLGVEVKDFFEYPIDSQ